MEALVGKVSFLHLSSCNALDHAMVPGLGRHAGKDVERWNAEKGAFMSDHGAQSDSRKAHEVPAAAVVESSAACPDQCCRKAE